MAGIKHLHEHSLEAVAGIAHQLPFGRPKTHVLKRHPLFSALVCRLPWTQGVKTWTVKVYVLSWKFHMQVVSVNRGFILHRFWDAATYWLKNVNFSYSLLI